MPGERHASATWRKMAGVWKRLRGRGDWLPTGDGWLGEAARALVRSMTERQRRVMYLRYVLDLDQYVVAKALGISQSAVSQAESDLLGRARPILSSLSTGRKSKGSARRSRRRARR